MVGCVFFLCFSPSVWRSLTLSLSLSRSPLLLVLQLIVNSTRTGSGSRFCGTAFLPLLSFSRCLTPPFVSLSLSLSLSLPHRWFSTSFGMYYRKWNAVVQ